MRYYPVKRDLPSPHEVNRAVEEAFREYGEGRVQMPPKVYVTFDKGDFRTMPAYLPGIGIAGVKVVNVHPENPTIGLPTVMALTVVLDPATGMPEAVLNATRLTDLRGPVRPAPSPHVTSLQSAASSSASSEAADRPRLR